VDIIKTAYYIRGLELMLHSPE